MSAETPGTDQDDIEALNRRLAGVVQQALRDGETDMNAGDCNRAGWHVAEAVLASDWLAAYIARKVEAVERERDEARAAVESWVRNTVSADGRYYRLRDAVLGADTCPAHEFVPVAGHPDDDECTHRWDDTDATYCGRPRADHEHDWDAEAVERAKKAWAVIERVTALADETPAEAFWKASVAGAVERDRGGYYGRGFRDGYGRAQADLRAALGPATHVHQCASAGYPDHEPSSSCLCICGERFDGTHTEPTVPASARPLTLDEHLAEVRAWHHKAYNSTSDEVWERNPVCASDGHGWPCDVEIVGRGVDQVVDAALAEIERRITELPTTRTQSFVTGWSSVSLGDVLDILREYREEIRHG